MVPTLPPHLASELLPQAPVCLAAGQLLLVASGSGVDRDDDMDLDAYRNALDGKLPLAHLDGGEGNLQLVRIEVDGGMQRASPIVDIPQRRSKDFGHAELSFGSCSQVALPWPPGGMILDGGSISAGEGLAKFRRVDEMVLRDVELLQGSEFQKSMRRLHELVRKENERATAERTVNSEMKDTAQLVIKTLKEAELIVPSQLNALDEGLNQDFDGKEAFEDSFVPWWARLNAEVPQETEQVEALAIRAVRGAGALGLRKYRAGQVLTVNLGEKDKDLVPCGLESRSCYRMLLVSHMPSLCAFVFGISRTEVGWTSRSRVSMPTPAPTGYSSSERS